MTPLEVVKKYNEECWNNRQPDLAGDILADKVVRNYPGERKVLSRKESVERIRESLEQLSKLDFNFHHFFVAGDIVTMIWDADATYAEDGKDTDGKETIFGGIEVFRVENGKICEVWNSEYSFEKRWP